MGKETKPIYLSEKNHVLWIVNTAIRFADTVELNPPKQKDLKEIFNSWKY